MTWTTTVPTAVEANNMGNSSMSSSPKVRSSSRLKFSPASVERSTYTWSSPAASQKASSRLPSKADCSIGLVEPMRPGSRASRLRSASKLTPASVERV